MSAYSLRLNLQLMGLALTRPKTLIEQFAAGLPLLHGIVPFLIYIAFCEIGWLSAYLSGAYQAINPLPKLLPLPDQPYLLYQSIFGPFVKAAGVFIFISSLALIARGLGVAGIEYQPLANFYLLVSSTLAIVAIAIDQVIVWGALQGGVKFLVSTVHPLIFVLAVIYLYWYLRQDAHVPKWKALFLVVPSMLLAGPIPGLFFR